MSNVGPLAQAVLLQRLETRSQNAEYLMILRPGEKMPPLIKSKMKKKGEKEEKKN